MIYQWKCNHCTAIVDVSRSIDDCMVPPTEEENKSAPTGRLMIGGPCDQWVRVFSSSTPFITLTDKGVFAKLPA